MSALKDFEVIVDRRLQFRFVVKARSTAEAAMAVGQQLAGGNPFEGSIETVLDQRMMQPKIIHVVAEPAPTLALDDAGSGPLGGEPGTHSLT